MNSIVSTTYDVSTISRRCSLCGIHGHNMTTCIRLRFRQNQVHRLYVHMWQKWFQATRVESYYSSISNYPNSLLEENKQWLNNIQNFRLIKSYLKLNTLGTNEQIKTFIIGLYYHLIVTKYGDYDLSSDGLYGYSFNSYHYLLETFSDTVFSNFRNYEIQVQRKIAQEDTLPEACPICYDDFPTTNLIVTSCCHAFCEKCITNTIKILPDNKKLACAMCRSNIHYLSCYNSETNTNLKNILNL